MSFINHRADALAGRVALSSRLPQERRLVGAYDSRPGSRIAGTLEGCLLLATAGMLCLLLSAVAAGVF